jgi:SAM-dependent methyltransferase
MDAADIQRAHFAKTASAYDTAHEGDEHDFALEWLYGGLARLRAESLLDVGAGTGRILRAIAAELPSMTVMGVEPVAEMREAGYQSGLTPETLVSGEAESLSFASKSFDVVTAFALLHHVARPQQVIAEMMRVAREAVFISDCNNFGHGSAASRAVKCFMRFAGLWRPFVFLRTKGKGFDVSDGDGASYSYSIFDSVPQLRREFPSIYMLTTKPADSSYLRIATSHAAILATINDSNAT